MLLECCELVGRFVVPESYLPHILPRIREEPDVDIIGERWEDMTLWAPSYPYCFFIKGKILHLGLLVN